MFSKLKGNCVGITMGNEILASIHCGLNVLPISIISKGV